MKIKKLRKLNLTFSIVLLVFIVLTCTLMFIGMTITFLTKTGYFSYTVQEKFVEQNGNSNHIIFVVSYFILCLFLGTSLSVFLSKKTIRPIKQVINATHEVAHGNFDIKIDLKGVAELDDLSESFNIMTQELKSIETLKSNFVNNFSHEFKTPIVSIQGFAKLLKNENLPSSERKEYLDIIISESERLSSLSSNILILSQYENMGIITNKSIFRLDEQIRQCVLILEPKWNHKNIQVQIDLASIKYSSNEDLTMQIWINLIENAIKFSDDNSIISIELTKSDHQIQFRIKDYGIGMDSSTLSHIFDKFYQGDSSHSVSGNGLGLPLVKQILTLLNGTIRIESSPNQGSLFIINLPT